jgi:hypothetical protein
VALTENGSDSASGIAQNLKTELRVFPNPASDFLQITGLERSTRMHLMDISGRMVFEVLTTQSTHRIDTYNYTPGQYVLLVLSEDMQPQHISIIVQ